MKRINRHFFARTKCDYHYRARVGSVVASNFFLNSIKSCCVGTLAVVPWKFGTQSLQSGKSAILEAKLLIIVN